MDLRISSWDSAADMRTGQHVSQIVYGVEVTDMNTGITARIPNDCPASQIKKIEACTAAVQMIVNTISRDCNG